ncbi:trimeric intracellular cation channel family protein [Deferribacterales bacterium RsTz2092]|nr:membrane protein [Deferribacterales bacterium]
MGDISFLYHFDLAGTFAFAVSGAMLGVKKDMDIYGQLILALAVAVGGGTIRDVFLGSLPPFIFRDENYFYIVSLAVVLVALFTRYFERSISYLNLADAIGLGTFTVIGANKALMTGLEWQGVLFCAVLTATGGGMLRDILAGEIPVVLKREIYASASILGGALFYVMYAYNVPYEARAFITAAIVVLVRLIALKKNLNLPHIS